MSRRFLLVASVAVGSLAANVVDAQIFTFEPPPRDRGGSWSFDVAGQFAQPTGAFRTQVSRAWGVGGSVRHHFRWLAPLGLRGDFTYLNYGNENQRVPLSPTVNRVLVDMNTTNNIVVVSGGPELALTSGPLRPYAYVFAGYSYFYTQSSAGDDGDGGSFASSTNFDDGGLATGWGGGLRLPLRFRSVGAAVDAGARLTRSGTRSYLRPGDIRDQPDGSLQFTPRRTVADFWQYHIGISLSPRGR
jgi:hypothetical protein